MKKYRVLRECIYGEVNQEFKTEDDLFIKFLVHHGWLAEVPEEKELWAKIFDCEDHQGTVAEAKSLAKIAHEHDKKHFAEVARKASNEWVAQSSLHYNISITDHIIQTIEKDGEA